MTSIDYAKLYSDGLPDPSPRWAPFPPYYFVGGNNDPEQIPIEGLVEAAASVLRREGSKLAIYNLGLGPQGYPGLRQFVADRCNRLRGMKASVDDVTIVTGSGQGIDMISKLLVNPGDTVLCEEFCYQGAMRRFRQLGAKLEAMKLDADGIVIDALASQLAALKAKGITPKFIYTIPTIQNPTASILPLDRRHALLKLAREYNVAIFEDECYADLLWEGVEAPPALYALDPGSVIHLGSFSKSLAPALRLGYIVAEWEIMRRLLPLKGDSGTGALDQMVVAEYFSKNFDKHLNHLNGVLHDKLDTMVEAVQREFGTTAECWHPKGGIFLWIKLPDSVDVRKLVKPAADAGIIFNEGPAWAVSADNSASHLRLCFAMPSKQTIRDGVAALAQVCYEQTGIPVRSRECTAMSLPRRDGPRYKHVADESAPYETISVDKYTPIIGAEIAGADLTKLSNRQVDEIHRALAENCVIFFRDQHLTPEQHLAFGRNFGDLHIHPAAPHAPGHDELMIIHADKNSPRANGEGWHSDVSCDPTPPMGSILYVKQTPPKGGDTLFASMYAAYEALSDRMKAYVEGLNAIHDGEENYRGTYAYAGVQDKQDYPRAEHPVVRTHPVTGKKALYVNRGFTKRLVGVPRDESRALLEYLYEHAENPLFQCRFRWQPNSVAFWDNRCVQHRAMWDYWPHTRSGFRVTVAGDKPY